MKASEELLAAVGNMVDLFESDEFTDDPDDPGGATKYGVTRALYSEYLSMPAGSLCDVDLIRHLTRDEAITCLVEMFALRPGLYQIGDPVLRFVVVDFAIHSHHRTATKALQKAAGVKADGICGPDTLAAVNAGDARRLRDQVLAARLDLWASIWTRKPTQRKWAGGWCRRLAKNLRFPALMLLSITAAIAPIAAADWPTVLKAVPDQVPRLEVLIDGSVRGVCSSVVINADAGVALTAAHCVEHAPTQSIDLTLNGRHAEVARVNRILDLAVVRFDRKHEISLPLAAATPAMGSDVAIVGYAFGSEDLHAQVGIISRPLNRETKTIWVNADIIPGDSGGAVINAAGELVGMSASVYYKGPSHMAAAIPIETIRDFIEPYLPKGPKP